MKEIIQKAVERVISSLRAEGVFPSVEIPNVEVSFPKDDMHGDYTSNIAMALARMVKKPPMDIANLLKEKLSSDESMKSFHIEVVAPGYLNFSYTEEALANIVTTIREQGVEYGFSKEKVPHHTILLEYISANPTGPLHIGNARGGFLGDALANILKKAGYAVSTEYYVNDAGEQVMKLGHSVLKDSEAVYGGEYIENLNEKLKMKNEKLGDSESDPRAVGEWAGEKVLEEYIKKTISEKMKISFDRFVSEKKDIVELGYIDRAIAFFREQKLTYEAEEALWLKTTAFGDDKDRVLVKANGEKTYFASDCGYILHKKDRGFEKLIEIWGADHHGYVARFRAAAEAFGFAKDDVRFALVQMVKVVKDGQEVRMSKRAGNVVSVDELLEAIPVDVARFFFLMYSSDTHMNFDLGLAEERSRKNPVFYVQYAHARMASILRKAEEDEQCKIQNEKFKIADVSFVHPKEILLIRHLAKFPEVVEEAAETLTVHQLPQYAIRLADCFHSFYDECTVIDVEQKETTRSRLALVRATKTMLAETLRLLGISAPERM
jgi:arginyl-tRNA synthetase